MGPGVPAGPGEEPSDDEAADARRSYRFLPRVLCDVSWIGTGSELLGERLNSPVLAAPTAFRALRPVVEAPVDGGVRTGTDVLTS
ncbi:alpha-hydroxy-acid oxidizing protein [Streptomyces sp. NPDC040724]|uniref:alpha-hydroxy-acid oxidizing protein n=1 Tax=Streptomyces sp. NPDC040724 TaxID=3155612 RepID=UPI0033D83BEF